MMNFVYGWWCSECGHTHREPVVACARCGSNEIDMGKAYGAAQDDADDEEAEKRMAEIRAQSNHTTMRKV